MSVFVSIFKVTEIKECRVNMQLEIERNVINLFYAIYLPSKKDKIVELMERVKKSSHDFKFLETLERSDENNKTIKYKVVSPPYMEEDKVQGKIERPIELSIIKDKDNPMEYLSQLSELDWNILYNKSRDLIEILEL